MRALEAYIFAIQLKAIPQISFFMCICCRIVDPNDTFIGAVKITLNLHEINSILLNSRKLREYSSTVLTLLDRNKKTLFSTTPFKSNDFALMPTVKSSLQEKNNHNGYCVVLDHSDGHEKLIAYAESEGYKNFGGAGWCLIIQYNTSDIFQPIYNIKNILLLASLGIIFVSLIFGFLFSYFVVVRPVSSLRMATVELSNGNLNAAARITSNDELGEVAKLFNATVESIRGIGEAAQKVTDGDTSVELEEKTENDILAKNFNIMMRKIKEQKVIDSVRNWKAHGFEKYSDILRLERELVPLANHICHFFASYFKIQIAVIYILKDDKLHLTGSYAYSKNAELKKEIEIGEGFAGQAAKMQDIIVESNIPENYTKINSATGSSKPYHIVAMPFVYSNNVIGVIEIGAFSELKDEELGFFMEISERTAIAFRNILVEKRQQELLIETQRQADELQQHQKELKTSNDELLQKARILEAQKKVIEGKNITLKKSQNELWEKSRELQSSSKYKTEFLANMSHELRTPLNSMLILSKRFSMNKDKNLTAQQVKSAEIVYNSGRDLLNMINDILDLSKIEAGKMPVRAGKLYLSEFKGYLYDNFKPIADEKKLKFSTVIEENLDSFIFTDRQKLEQVIRNFLSNSLKFTKKGSVTVKIFAPKKLKNGVNATNYVAVSVFDTGIGIPKNKQKIIFDAFQQVDGSTARKFGGTGLGLSISLELAKLLGGYIDVSSSEGQGSSFTIYFLKNLKSSVVDKEDTKNKKKTQVAKTVPKAGNGNMVQNSKTVSVNHGEHLKVLKGKTVLIVDDDARSLFLLDQEFKELKMNTEKAVNGEMALKILRESKNVDIILMDIMMPVMDGYTAIKKIKSNAVTAKIPIIAVTAKAMSEDRENCLKAGADDYLMKPIEIEKLTGLMKIWIENRKY